MTRRKGLVPGQVWVTRSPKTRTPSRRVIHLVKGKVCYSVGGDSLRWCQRAAFRLWIRTYDARVARTTQKRSLTLRSQRSAFSPEAARKRSPAETADGRAMC